MAGRAVFRGAGLAVLLVALVVMLLLLQPQNGWSTPAAMGAGVPPAETAAVHAVAVRPVVLAGVETTVAVTLPPQDPATRIIGTPLRCIALPAILPGQEITAAEIPRDPWADVPVRTAADGVATCTLTVPESGAFTVLLRRGDDALAVAEASALPGIVSLVPALVAIALALTLRNVIVALFAGVWSGAWLLAGADFSALFHSVLRLADTYLVRALVPADGSTEHITIVLFTLMTGGMIGVITRNGGVDGVVRLFSRVASSPRRAQAATYGLGAAIFFDDYANTLIVGNTMRPLTQRQGVSPEKLAYVVDSTAAPMACIALVTTWIGFQVSLLEDALAHLPAAAGWGVNGYGLMAHAIPYSFYPILALIFIAMLIAWDRDFGPMGRAERAMRARVAQATAAAAQSGPQAMQGAARAVQASLPAVASPPPPQGLAMNAIVPILTLIGTTLTGLYLTGRVEGGAGTLTDILGNADPFRAMLWASLLSLIVAIALSVATRRLTLRTAVAAMESGLVPMLAACVVLTFAWAIADINKALLTADYVVSLLGQDIPPMWLPAIIFVTAAIISFATGSSWGTMAILVPLVLPLTASTLTLNGLDFSTGSDLIYASVAAVLAGAVWGDHCSPISDTTILSAVASGCDLMAHVRTQLPYAMTVAGVSLVLCLIPVGMGAPWWLGLLMGVVALALIVKLLGRPNVAVKL